MQPGPSAQQPRRAAEPDHGQPARDYHTQALATARDLGVPLEQARAIEGIDRSHLQDGHAGEGVAHLRQALDIYQRIGAPDADRIKRILNDHAT